LITRELTIRNKSGLHARPATLWVKAASQFQSVIRLKTATREADGKSLLGILTLGLSAGSTVQLQVEGADEAQAVVALENLLVDMEAKGE
jgi:phosphocarrier protein HPr